MGIPSYFSYIVKNHIQIIQKITPAFHVDNLYLDSNSIIYDCFHKIDFSCIDSIDNSILISKKIIHDVIIKIEEYIKLLSPNNTIYIAFDGVAPLAKLEQQRNRRFKSWYILQYSNEIFKSTERSWDSTAITPGTKFMNMLNTTIKKHFLKKEKKYNVSSIIVSGSDEHGEGEHKLFNYIRENKIDHCDKTSIIYGLDADLIMLAINHLPICKNIYLFRETPEFIKCVDSSLEPNESYLLDIPELSKNIILQMKFNPKIQYCYDYIFLCFFLGNDFAPHFPSLNIRTDGIHKLLNAYKLTLGDKNICLTDGNNIFWKNLRLLIEYLASQEEEYFKNEMKKRDKREKYKPTINTKVQSSGKIDPKTPVVSSFAPDLKKVEEKLDEHDIIKHKMDEFQAIPNYDRGLEKFINPFKNGWQERYYKALFNIDSKIEDKIEQICINYLEMLEWTMEYYTNGCKDWRWSYKYNYPPLLQDLIKYIPFFERKMLKAQDKNPVSPLLQLCYVLPRNSLIFLPNDINKILIKKYSHWYPTDCQFLWAFCKYFWESHVMLPEIDITILEDIIQEYNNKKIKK
jgi:5'-3' exonuclease